MGGGVDEWTAFVDRFGEFTIQEKRSVKTKVSVERLILEMRWKEGADRTKEVDFAMEESKEGDSDDLLDF